MPLITTRLEKKDLLRENFLPLNPHEDKKKLAEKSPGILKGRKHLVCMPALVVIVGVAHIVGQIHHRRAKNVEKTFCPINKDPHSNEQMIKNLVRHIYKRY